jgi:hypothetical protein
MAVEPEEIGLEEYNQRLRTWNSAVGKKIRSAIQMLTSKGKGDLLKSFKDYVYERDGEVDKLTYKFTRHGIFAHKGVGRGYVMIGGTVVHVPGYVSKKSIMDYAKRKGRTYSPPASAGLKRKAILWFNPIVQGEMDSLANMVAEMNANRAVNATRLLIK